MANSPQNLNARAVPPEMAAPAPPSMPMPMPTPPSEGYYSNPHIRLNWPGLSVPDSLRQGFVPGVRLKRFFPVSNR